ncbi:MAG: hypothetical protein WBA83_16205 [Burkholderiaceae bacterium]
MNGHGASLRAQFNQRQPPGTRHTPFPVDQDESNARIKRDIGE